MERSRLCAVTWEFTFDRPDSRSRIGRNHHIWGSWSSGSWRLVEKYKWLCSQLVLSLPKIWTLSHSSDIFDKSHDLFLALSLSPPQYFCNMRAILDFPCLEIIFSFPGLFSPRWIPLLLSVAGATKVSSGRVRLPGCKAVPHTSYVTLRDIFIPSGFSFL